MDRLTENFSRSEFKCKCGECSQDTIDYKLLELLQTLRNRTGARITINSGNRCPAHNGAVGGAPNSQHLLGRAADIVVEGVSPSQVGSMMEELMGAAGGIGIYETFTHIDTRTNGMWRHNFTN